MSLNFPRFYRDTSQEKRQIRVLSQVYPESQDDERVLKLLHSQRHSVRNFVILFQQALSFKWEMGYLQISFPRLTTDRSSILSFMLGSSDLKNREILEQFKPLQDNTRSSGCLVRKASK